MATDKRGTFEMTDNPKATTEQLVEAINVFVKFLNAHQLPNSSKELVIEFAVRLIGGSYQAKDIEEPND